MRRFRQWLLVWMAVLWLPVTVHCLLESAGGLEFLACCTHDESESTPHQDADCEEDGCALVESGQYRSSDRRDEVSGIWILSVRALSPVEDVSAEVPQDDALDRPAPDPDIASDWRFVYRVALPPRAPTPTS